LKATDKTSKLMATKILDEMYKQETEMGISFLIKHREELEINKEKEYKKDLMRLRKSLYGY
jgi:hypothetical protein